METKPGVRTSEFWVAVVLSALPWLATVADNANVVNIVPERWRWVLPVVSAAATAIIAHGYAVGRGKAKQGVPYTPTS